MGRWGAASGGKVKLMPQNGRLEPGEARSAGSLRHRRVPQAWPKDRRFRILAIDGGGIRGVFPATLLAELERHHTGGRPVGEYFDLAAGTSTGGILALGLAAGLSAGELQDLYVRRGSEIFPPRVGGLLGRLIEWLTWPWYLGSARYSQKALREILGEKLGDRTIGDARLRLCIPCFDGCHSEVYVFKTPHHPDYRTDRFDPMIRAALATAAAPVYFRPLVEGGYTFVDGGVWANNPSMLAVIEALTAFDVDRARIDVLSLGCGDDAYRVNTWQRRFGGLFFWRTVIFAAMRLQSLAATNQARLLLGADQVIRIDAPTNETKIRIDDCRRAIGELVPAAKAAAAENGEEIARLFLAEPAATYEPIPVEEAETGRPSLARRKPDES